MKICSTCKDEKPLENFAKNARKPDGLQYKCKDCMKLYNQSYYPATKDKYNPARAGRRDRLRVEIHKNLIDYLVDHPCVDCGERDIVVLEFDHLRDKKFNISRMVSNVRPWDEILAEIEKCEVVCGNDHKRRTAQTFGWFKLNHVPIRGADVV